MTEVRAPIEHRPAGIGSNPSVGPRSIRRGEPLYGRGRETNELCSTLVAARIVLLYAVSGAGKTSLLEAGLRTELERREFAVLPTIRVGHDVSNLASGSASNRYTTSTLLSLEEGRPQATRLRPGELSTMSLEDYLGRYVRERDDALDPCLFFDQFEELFTLDPIDEQAKRDFIGQLGGVLRDPGLWAVFAMREDLIAQLDPYASMIPERWDTRYRLELLGPAAAKGAIQGPAADAGRHFANDAADLLIDDLRRVRVQRGAATVEAIGPNVEPVQLQVVCRELWDRVDPHAVSIEASDVQAVGDVNDALARFYEDAIALTSHRTGVSTYSLGRWFSNVLITPFGTRSMALQGPESTEDLPNDAVASLEDLHIIRAETRAGARWYELTHDRFIDPVQASNASMLSKRSPSLWGLVPLLVGGAMAIAFAFSRLDRGVASAIIYFICGGLVGLGLGELVGTALDRDGRRLMPRRVRRGWRLALGLALFVLAALCLLGSISLALDRPENMPYVDFPSYVSRLTGSTVAGSPSCNATNFGVFTQRPEPDITRVFLRPSQGSDRPSALPDAAVRDLARRWCRDEATTNIWNSTGVFAVAVGLITVVGITWYRRRRRRSGRRRGVAPRATAGGGQMPLDRRT